MAQSSDDRPVILWFRRDLRMGDNPALGWATETGRPVLPVFIHDDQADWAPGGASRWWLHGSLDALGQALNALGAPLLLRRGPMGETIRALVEEVDAGAIAWNRLYDPISVARDTELKRALSDAGLEVKSFAADALIEPPKLRTGQDRPYQVYTPFAKAARKAIAPVSPPAPAPDALNAMTSPPKGDALNDWGFLPTKPDWASGLRSAWTPGEDAAHARLEGFLDRAMSGYAEQRDRPDIAGTSGLSPHLAWGEISPRAVWTAAEERGGGDKFLAEILWRDFSRHVLFHFPDLPEKSLKPDFESFPWRKDDEGLRAWTRGMTGYPLVDAGMRQLYATGWMHNRVRMAAASFLIKHLMVDWREGQAWFWDTLVDADLATNSASWQWVAGSGADAAPFFRIFNPTLQARKFDPEGKYIRRWVPELSELPNKRIHAPFEASEKELKMADIRLGETYPKPIIDHGFARQRALDAFQSLRQRAAA